MKPPGSSSGLYPAVKGQSDNAALAAGPPNENGTRNTHAVLHNENKA
jgi:hypothetical protein